MRREGARRRRQLQLQAQLHAQLHAQVHAQLHAQLHAPAARTCPQSESSFPLCLISSLRVKLFHFHLAGTFSHLESSPSLI